MKRAAPVPSKQEMASPGAGAPGHEADGIGSAPEEGSQKPCNVLGSGRDEGKPFTLHFLKSFH